MVMISSVPLALLVIENNGHSKALVILLIYLKKQDTRHSSPRRPKIQYFASASFPCKSLVCHIFDMRVPWFWAKIWHGSISGNVCLIKVSNHAKFDAFIKKRTILSLNSRTISGPLKR